MPPVSPNGVPFCRRDRVVEVVGAHHAEHRAEALGLVEPRALGDAEPDAGRPAPARDRFAVFAGFATGPLAGLDEPPLALVERREAAAAAVSDGGSISGAIIVAGSSASPTRTLRTAAASRAQELAVVVHRGGEDQQAGGRALLAGVAERRADDVADRRVDVGGLGDDDRVLAARLGEQAQRRLPVEEHAAPWRTTPVSTTVATSSWVIRRLPTSSSGQATNCSTSRGTPARQHWLASSHAV